MDEKKMETKIKEVLDKMEVEALEERIAPVDCAKKPDHPDCQPIMKYGIAIP